jgi:hypothetical protein
MGDCKKNAEVEVERKRFEEKFNEFLKFGYLGHKKIIF